VLLGRSPLGLREQMKLLQEISRSQMDSLCDDRRDADGIEPVLAGLTRWTSMLVETSPTPDPVAAAMVGRIVSARGRLAIGRLSDGTGVGYRQALRRFIDAVGLSPKALSRLLRVRHACLGRPRALRRWWATVSASGGFADQAHLSREFSDVYGWPPRLVREYLKQVEHLHVSA
jgi:AraC-like DNA-binding protein